MNKIIIGVDPDSKAHGVAIYKNGKLIELCSSPLVEFIDRLEFLFSEFGSDIEINIEDVCAVSNSQFHWKPTDSQAVKAKKSENIGLCKQSQIELERFVAKYELKVVKHKISKLWKKDKAQFEKVTGWKGRSNEDTRSAAYFGFLGIR